jgi:hypothetical protein
LLAGVACLPREFTIVVEESNFAAVQGYRHEMRMTFDISPYPALEAYTKQSGRSIRADENIPWLNEPRSFYAGQLPDEFEEGRTTDDDTILGYHNCVMSYKRTQWLKTELRWNRHGIGRESFARVSRFSRCAFSCRYCLKRPFLLHSTNINGRHPNGQIQDGQFQDGARLHWARTPCFGTSCHIPPRHKWCEQPEAEAKETASIPASALAREPLSRRAGFRAQTVTQGNQEQAVRQDRPSAGILGLIAMTHY